MRTNQLKKILSKELALLLGTVLLVLSWGIDKFIVVPFSDGLEMLDQFESYMDFYEDRDLLLMLKEPNMIKTREDSMNHYLSRNHIVLDALDNYTRMEKTIDKGWILPDPIVSDEDTIQIMYMEDTAKINFYERTGDLAALIKLLGKNKSAMIQYGGGAQTNKNLLFAAFSASKVSYYNLSLWFFIAGTVLVTANRLLKYLKKDNDEEQTLWIKMLDNRIQNLKDFIKSQKKGKDKNH